MPTPFPHRYEVSLSRTAPSQATIESPPGVAIAGGPPPEFDGEPGRWSPEHLLLSAIGLCLLTTFEAFARRAGMPVAGWASRSSGVLEKTKEGLVFTSFDVEVLVTVAPGDLAQAEALVAQAKRHCLVSNALKVPVEVVTICAPVGVAA